MTYLRLLVALAFLSAISSEVIEAHATNGWTKSDSPPSIRHTASNPGSTKICGDHKCAPFENMKKSSQDMARHILQAKLRI